MISSIAGRINKDDFKIYNIKTEIGETNVDIDSSAELLFQNGFKSKISASFKKHLGFSSVIHGEHGKIILVVPCKESNFDHKRLDTKFETVLNAYTNNFDESDLSNLEEILDCHDIELDPGVKTFEEFRKRSLLNFQNRCLHHHVYSNKLLREMLAYTNFEIIDIGSTEKDFYALAKKNSIQSY